MKKVIYILIFLVIVLLIALKLRSNKQNIKEAVKQAEQTVSSFPVTTKSVKLETIRQKIELIGTVSPYKDMRVISQAQGEVVEVTVEKGGNVEKGELIAQISDDLLKAELAVARANYQKLKGDLKSFERLVEGGAIPKQKLEEVRLNKKNAEAKYSAIKKRLSETRIVSPIKGNVNQLFVEEGTLTGQGAPVANIVNIDLLIAMLSVTESDLSKVHKGQSATISSQTFPEHELKGEVSYIGLTANRALQYPVEIVFENTPEKIFKGGMIIQVSIDISDQKPKILVPRSAVIGSLKSPKVYVEKDDKAYVRALVIDDVIGEKVVIKSGIEPGESLIVGGNENLYDGASVNIIK